MRYPLCHAPITCGVREESSYDILFLLRFFRSQMPSVLTRFRSLYRKEVYREVFDAVLRAEALVQPAGNQAPADPSSTATATAEFKLYTPSTCSEATRLDADGDTDMDAGYSSDWDSDEDEDDEDDDMLDADLDDGEPTYDAVVALDGSPTTTRKPQLPRLSSIRVYALEAVPEQTGRNGVPFMGRGTPVDRQRRADWASPPKPALPDEFSLPQTWTPTPSPPATFYSPSPELGFASIDAGLPLQMGMDMGMSSVYQQQGSPMPISLPMQVHMPAPVSLPSSTPYSPNMMAQPYGDCLSWLDPSLRAQSASASPSPSPAPPSSVFIAGMGYPPTPPPAEYPMQIPSTPSPASSPNASTSSSSVDSSPSLGSPSPTGCALHASFLQCLQSSGCAPFFSAPPVSVSPSPCPAPAPSVSVCAPPLPEVVPYNQSMGGVGGGMFPNQELAHFVRTHLVPGSVTLSHALG